MTLLESLKKSREMWQWLADHPDVTHKWVYFEWAKIPREEQPLNQCYVCDAVLKSENAYECEGDCPIEWIKGHDIPYACEGWEEKGFDQETDELIEIQHETEYNNWCMSLPDKGDFRRESALEIVKLHDEAIVKLKEDQDGKDQG